MKRGACHHAAPSRAARVDPSSRLSVGAIPQAPCPSDGPAGSSATLRLSERGGEEGQASRMRAAGAGDPAHLTAETEGPRLSQSLGAGPPESSLPVESRGRTRSAVRCLPYSPLPASAPLTCLCPRPRASAAGTRRRSGHPPVPGGAPECDLPGPCRPVCTLPLVRLQEQLRVDLKRSI